MGFYLLLAARRTWRRPCVSNTVTNSSIAFFLFCKCFKCVVSPLSREATNITQTCALRCIKCTFKIDNYLWHGFICCWQLEGRRACVSNIVTNLSTMFPYYKCSKCLVRHLGRPPTSPRNLFKFPLKIDKYLWHGFICCWPLEGRRACVSNSATNLNIVVFPFLQVF